MVKLGIFYEQDDAGKDTGRVQVADVDEEIVYDTFDTEEEAETEMAKMQAEFDMKDKITEEYLEWEKQCLACHEIDKDELRRYLVNVVII
ncbi:hypothetical protein ES707_00518 [subsurface metagenome]